jgi:hypothetical protein
MQVDAQRESWRELNGLPAGIAATTWRWLQNGTLSPRAEAPRFPYRHELVGFLNGAGIA